MIDLHMTVIYNYLKYHLDKVDLSKFIHNNYFNSGKLTVSFTIDELAKGVNLIESYLEYCIHKLVKNGHIKEYKLKDTSVYELGIWKLDTNTGEYSEMYYLNPNQ